MADLVDLETYKLYQQRTAIGEFKNEKDLYYSQLLLPAASQAIRQFYNNDFESKARTETISLIEQTRFIIPRFRPIASVTSIKIEGDALDADEFYIHKNLFGLTASTSHLFLLSNRVDTHILWPLGFDNIELNYVGGQALTQGDKWTICKLIAKLDDNDTQQFQGATEAVSAFEAGIAQDSLFDRQMEQYRKWQL